jgi:hypothetical protein
LDIVTAPVKNNGKKQRVGNQRSGRYGWRIFKDIVAARLQYFSALSGNPVIRGE